MAEARRLPLLTARRLLLGVVLLVAASGILYATVGSAKYVARLMKGQPDSNKIVRQGLYVNAEDLDLREVYYTDTLEHTFTVHNPTDQPIVIESWWTSCNCSAVEPKQVTVPTHGSSTVKGIVNLPSALKETDSLTTKSLAVLYLPIIQNRTQRSFNWEDGWKTTAKVKPLLVGPRTVTLGENSEYAKKKKRQFVWTLGEGVYVTEISCDDKYFDADIVSIANNKIAVEIKQKHILPIGKYYSDIYLNTIANTTINNKIEIKVSLDIIEDIDSYPSDIFVTRNAIPDSVEFKVFSLTGNFIEIIDAYSTTPRSQLWHDEYRCIIFPPNDHNPDLENIYVVVANHKGGSTIRKVNIYFLDQ